MAAAHYKLVLFFDVADAAICQKVRECLTCISSPLATKKLDQVMLRGKVIIKKNADPAKDRRLVALLEKTGAECRFEKINSSPPPTRPNVTASIDLAAEEMVCPVCRQSQIKAAECRYCGVIVKKARPKIEMPDPPPIRETSAPQPAAEIRSTWPWADRLRRAYQRIQPFVDWMQGTAPKKSQVQRWSQKVGDAIARGIISFVIALLLEIGLLHLGHMLWFVYTATPVGQYYLASAGTHAQSLQYLAQLDLMLLGWQATVTAVCICLIAGAVGRFSQLVRFFHDPFGLPVKLVLWGLPLAGAAAWAISRNDEMISIEIAWLIVLVPTVLMVNRSIQLSKLMVPELSTFFGLSAGGFEKTYHLLKSKLLDWIS